MSAFGLGTPEIILIVAVIALFFFGRPKVMEWVKTFKETKQEAKKMLSEEK